MTGPLLSRITTDPAIFGGKPIIRGQRFAVEHLLGYLDAGMSEAELLAEFAFLESDDIAAARLYEGRQYFVIPGLAERENPESRATGATSAPHRASAFALRASADKSRVRNDRQTPAPAVRARPEKRGYAPRVSTLFAAKTQANQGKSKNQSDRFEAGLQWPP